MKHVMSLRLTATLLGIVLSATANARVIRDSIQSTILGVSKYYNIYLPEGFQRDAQRHYPVLYLLHGYTDDERAWQDKGQMDRVADELIASGEIQPMVIVMPGAGGPDTRNVWNGYFNMPGWNFEDFFYQEFIPAVEKKYRAGGSREQRAVAGLSMGGGGSVAYASEHTDMFSACYAMSAWLNAETKANVASNDKPGLLNAAVNKHNPFDKFENISDEEVGKLKGVAWFIDCGDDDFLLDQNLQLYKLFRQKGIRCQLRVRDGGHSWEYWHNALRMCLPFVSRNFR